MTLPPIDSDPLLLTTATGRVVSCAVRTLRRQAAAPRWIFVTAMSDLNGFLVPVSFVGPRYCARTHTSIDAIRDLVSSWWTEHERATRRAIIVPYRHRV